MAQHGKRIRAAREGIDRVKLYSLTEALTMVKDRSTAKFDETIEVAMNLGVDPRHADQMVRGVCNLPNGSLKAAPCPTQGAIPTCGSPAPPRQVHRKAWAYSSVVEHCVDIAGVASSILATPTIFPLSENRI